MMQITYSRETQLDPNEFICILKATTLGPRRPVEDFSRIERMCKNANLIIVARSNGQLVGVARAITDEAFCTYLSDLAVHEKFQHQGIGKELIRKVKEFAPEAKLILLSAPAATAYYPKIGLTQHPAAFTLDDSSKLK